jgi:hypothetical protein
MNKSGHKKTKGAAAALVAFALQKKVEEGARTISSPSPAPAATNMSAVASPVKKFVEQYSGCRASGFLLNTFEQERANTFLSSTTSSSSYATIQGSQARRIGQALSLPISRPLLNQPHETLAMQRQHLEQKHLEEVALFRASQHAEMIALKEKLARRRMVLNFIPTSSSFLSASRR